MLKLFKMLLERVNSQDCTSNESGTQTNEDGWKVKSRELVEIDGEYKIVCEKKNGFASYKGAVFGKK